jgi:hypothetical protein
VINKFYEDEKYERIRYVYKEKYEERLKRLSCESVNERAKKNLRKLYKQVLYSERVCMYYPGGAIEKRV